MNNFKTFILKNKIKIISVIIFSIILSFFLFFLGNVLYSIKFVNSIVQINYIENLNQYSKTYWWLILVIFIFSFFGFSVYFYYKSLKKNYIKDSDSSEFGSADWLINQKVNANANKEKFNIEFPKNSNEPGFVVLMQQETKKKKDKEWVFHSTLEKHVLVEASSGGGKTQKIVIPSIYYNATLKEKAPSMFIVDPKGDVFKKLRNHLVENEYKIFCLDLRNSKKSDCWNPLDQIHDLWAKYLENSDYYLKAKVDDLIIQLVNCLLPRNSNNDSPIWITNARNILIGSIYFFLETWTSENYLSKNEFNLSRILKIIKKYDYFKNLIIEQNLKNSNNKFFQYLANSYLIETEATRDGYLANLNSLSATFCNESIESITSTSDFKLSDLINNKTALFVIVPDEEKSKHSIISLLINSIYTEAIRIASLNDELKLSRQLQMYCEETANIPIIEDFDSKISASRSRNIFFMVVLQSINQLKNKYGETANTILANLQTKIFIDVDEKDSSTLSKSFGKKTIIKSSFSGKTEEKNIKFFQFKDKDDSYNEQLSSIDLMTAGDIESLEKPFGFIVKRKTKPSIVSFCEAYKNELINNIENYTAPDKLKLELKKEIFENRNINLHESKNKIKNNSKNKKEKKLNKNIDLSLEKERLNQELLKIKQKINNNSNSENLKLKQKEEEIYEKLKSLSN